MASNFDLGGLLKQAQQLQERLASAQDDLAKRSVEGTAGGGMVTVVVNGPRRHEQQQREQGERSGDADGCAVPRNKSAPSVHRHLRDGRSKRLAAPETPCPAALDFCAARGANDRFGHLSQLAPGENPHAGLTDAVIERFGVAEYLRVGAGAENQVSVADKRRRCPCVGDRRHQD